MSDMSPLSSKPVLSLPPNAYPPRVSKPPQVPPPDVPAAPPVPKPKPIAELDLAERLFGEAMRDNARVSLTFLDGDQITARPVAIGRYSFLIETS
jgi:hypothetical protein